MPLRLICHATTPIPIEIEGLTPDWAHDKTLAEIERFDAFCGNRQLPLAELFTVTGDPRDRKFVFEGHLSGVHWIGAHMRTGRIAVEGAAGRHVGSEMQGGEIRVRGEAGDWVGAEMRGGLIHIQGHAGRLVGAAYRGSARGMTGGTIIVDGNVGNEVGHTMRRGVIAIGGAAGDLVGFNMLAGTVVVMGNCGIRAGAGMRRGAICILGPAPPPLLPGFRYACTTRLNVLAIILRDLHRKGLGGDASRLTADAQLYIGDVLSGGRGEILLNAGDA